jgi:hypothetical protein
VWRGPPARRCRVLRVRELLQRCCRCGRRACCCVRRGPPARSRVRVRQHIQRCCRCGPRCTHRCGLGGLLGRRGAGRGRGRGGRGSLLQLLLQLLLTLLLLLWGVRLRLVLLLRLGLLLLLRLLRLVLLLLRLLWQRTPSTDARSRWRLRRHLRRLCRRRLLHHSLRLRIDAASHACVHAHGGGGVGREAKGAGGRGRR